MRHSALIFHVVLPGLASLPPPPAWLLAINRLSEAETSGGSESTGTHLALHVNKVKIFPHLRKQSAVLIFTSSRCANHTCLLLCRKKCWRQKEERRQHWKSVFLCSELDKLTLIFLVCLLFWHSDKDSLRIKKPVVRHWKDAWHALFLTSESSHESLYAVCGSGKFSSKDHSSLDYEAAFLGQDSRSFDALFIKEHIVAAPESHSLVFEMWWLTQMWFVVYSVGDTDENQHL